MRTLALSLALTCTAAPALAAPPEPARLRQLFEALEVAKLSTDMAAALEAQHAAQVAQEPDPELRARKQVQHDKLAAFLRERLQWSKLEPMAIEAYQGTLTAEDVDALLAAYATPVGQLGVKKLHPALISATLESMQQLEKTVEALMEAGSANPKELPAPWTAPDAHHAAAADLATELVKADFDARLQTIEATMREQVALTAEAVGADVGQDADAEVAKVAALFKDQVTFEAVKPTIARHLVAHLTEAELGQLLEDSRRPERRAQRLALRRAEEAFHARMQTWIRDELVPAMMTLLTESEAPPAATE